MLIQEVTESLQVRVQALAPLADRLFDICRGIKWSLIEDQCLIIRLSEGCVETMNRTDMFSDKFQGAVIVVELRSYIATLRDKIMKDDAQKQFEMPFPPQSVRSYAKKG
jgi:hypothetical protein